MRNRETQWRRFAALLVWIAAGSTCALATTNCSSGASAPLPSQDGFDADGGSFDPNGTDATFGIDAPSAAPALSVSAPQVDFLMVSCGASATSTLVLRNPSPSPTTIAATTTDPTFSVTPSVVAIGAGASSLLTLTATVPGSAFAGAPVVASLHLASETPGWKAVDVPLSVTPTGAVLAFGPLQGSTFAFPLTEVGSTAGLALLLSNTGNAPATFLVGPPSDPHFALTDDAGISLPAGGTWNMNVDFTSTNTAPVYANSVVSATGATCGSSLNAITYSGAGTTGHVSGWPLTLDFGATDCGGAAPVQRSFTLSNSGPVDAHIVDVRFSGTPGFTTTARKGLAITTKGATSIYVHGPAVPVPTYATSPITATLWITLDSEASPRAITLTEEPNGAILVFDTSATSDFGSFGSVPLLASSSQTFHVANVGSAPAHVTLTASPAASFGLSIPNFAINANGVENETATFAPTSGGGVTGSIVMTATGVVCAPLPAPIPLSGASGAAPAVSPAALSFGAICGNAAPPPQTVTVTNGGSSDMVWSMTGPTGPGAARYSVFASPPPGTLIPGAHATVTVAAAAMPSPAPSTAPSTFAATFTITTDVPFDPDHVIALGETPIGDQLSFVAQGPLRFGQVPVGTAVGQGFAVVNGANAGSPPAALSFSIVGTGGAAYGVAPGSVASLASGGSATTNERIVFAPTDASASTAALAIITADPLCTPLPSPLPLVGTGTRGSVAISNATLAFGTDPADVAGLVDCGKTGLSQTLTVSNLGNQAFNVTSLSLSKGATSPYSVSLATASLPAVVPIGGSLRIEVIPAPIPQTVPNPNDPSPFTDTLTIATDMTGDAPHAVSLVMQARGAIIANTPLATAWSFPSAPLGSIATFTSTITNTGNAGASVALSGLLQPAIFGVQSQPTTALAGGVTAIVGQFIPPAAKGSWTDQGTLSVTPVGALCAPLPSQWANSMIQLSGSSNPSP